MLLQWIRVISLRVLYVAALTSFCGELKHVVGMWSDATTYTMTAFYHGSQLASLRMTVESFSIQTYTLL
jgi:hypothetical protein